MLCVPDHPVAHRCGRPQAGVKLVLLAAASVCLHAWALAADAEPKTEGEAEALKIYDPAAVSALPPRSRDPTVVAWFQQGRQALARKEYPAALHWLWLAAEQGDAPSQALLGRLCLEGLGRAPDAAEAADWFRRAAIQGNVEAQRMLATLIRDGRGIEADDPEAVWWFRRAAEQGDAQAQTDLGQMALAGRGMAADGAEAAQWFLQAAHQGLPVAQYELGVSLAEGRGIASDIQAARQWLGRAADQAYLPARAYLRARDFAVQAEAQPPPEETAGPHSGTQGP